MVVAVAEHEHVHRAEDLRRAGLKPHDLVVVQFREEIADGRVLRVLMDLCPPAQAHGLEQARGGVDDGQLADDPARKLASRVGVRVLGVGVCADRRGVDGGVELGVGEAVQAERAGRTQEGPERVAERCARLHPAGNRDRRLARRPGSFGDLAARRDDEHTRPARRCLGVGCKRLLGPARIARSHDEAPRADPRGQRVVADDLERDGRRRRDERAHEVAADGRAAHADHDDAVDVGSAQREEAGVGVDALGGVPAGLEVRREGADSGPHILRVLLGAGQKGRGH